MKQVCDNPDVNSLGKLTDQKPLGFNKLKCSSCGTVFDVSKPHECDKPNRGNPTELQQKLLDKYENLATLSIKAEDGTVYEFEKPTMFDCGLLKITYGVVIGYIIEDESLYPMKWTMQGKYLNSSDKYDLTPIKPQWYEDECNFPALCKYQGDFIVVHHREDTGLHGTDFNWICEVDDTEIELATKQERDSLYVKDEG